MFKKIKKVWFYQLILIFVLLFSFSLISPQPVYASGAGWGIIKNLMKTVSDLFDPPLPWWHPKKKTWKGISQEDYDHLGLVHGPPETWEDGLRTNPNEYSFEWWYYDAHFSDGSAVVVVYFTKPIFNPEGPIAPFVHVTITTPEGEKIARVMNCDAADSFFSTTTCDIQIGTSYTYGDLQNYAIYAQIEDIEVNLNLQGLVPSYRSGTGFIFFETREKYFAWLSGVPNGIMSGSITYNGETHNVIGSGYHDHNWGTAMSAEHFKRWWWARGQIGPYTVIASDIRLKNKYGNNSWSPMFVILDSNGIVIDEASEDVTMTHTESDVREHPDPACPEQIAHTVTFNAYVDNGDFAEVRLDAQTLLSSDDLFLSMDLKPGEIFLLKLLGKNPWYTRFISNATMSFDINGLHYSDNGTAIIELMDLE